MGYSLISVLEAWGRLTNSSKSHLFHLHHFVSLAKLKQLNQDYERVVSCGGQIVCKF